MRGKSALEALRAQIAQIEGRGRSVGAVLPFGLAALDASLPDGGLARGAVHEIIGGGAADAPAHHPADGAAAVLFTAGIAGRAGGRVLWCLTRPDLFAPALDQAGLPPDRVIYVEAGADRHVLTCMEDGLRHGGAGAVVGEVTALPLAAARRLQLAAEGSRAIGLLLRRWPRSADGPAHGPAQGPAQGRRAASDLIAPGLIAPGLIVPGARGTRWRISESPTPPLPVPGVGRHHWRVELLRTRTGNSAEFIVEACDATGCLALPTRLVERPAAAADGPRAATG